MNKELQDLTTIIRPSGFATVQCGRDLYPWQAKTMDCLLQEGTRAALKTCNESGKTSEVIACLILWHMACFPGSTTVTTSASNRQI